MKKILNLIIFIAIPILVGGLSSLFAGNSSSLYSDLIKPNFAPNPIAFPIVWGILYAFMGISSYIIYSTTKDLSSLKIYFVQLFFNFCWSIIFFRFNLYFLAYIWILLMLIVIINMIFSFFNINKLAGILQIPLLIWVIFASLLNLGIVYLN